LRFFALSPIVQNIVAKPAEFLCYPLFRFISRIHVAGRCFNDVHNCFDPCPEMGMALQTFFDAWLGMFSHVISLSEIEIPMMIYPNSMKMFSGLYSELTFPCFIGLYLLSLLIASASAQPLTIGSFPRKNAQVHSFSRMTFRMP
jgi:hypothetical protein